MRASSIAGPVPVGVRTARTSTAGPGALTTARAGIFRLVAFAGLAGLAAWRFAMIEARPPLARVSVLLILALVVAAALISPVTSVKGRRGWMVARGCGLIAAAWLAALLAAGVPARLLLPTGWARLADRVGGGIQAVGAGVWPYAGHAHWARLDILLVLTMVPVLAGLAFWPEARRGPAAALRHGTRQAVAVSLLIGLYLTGVLDSHDRSMTLEGLWLLAGLAAWLWLPRLAGRRLLVATAWLLVVGGAGACVAVPLVSRQPWFDYRGWNLLGAQRLSFFAWDQTYGPITWPRSQRTMFTVRASAPGLWKVTTLDRFDGLRFIRSGTDQAVEDDLPLPLDDRWYQFATFTIAGFGSGILPTEDGTTEGVNARFPVRYEADGTVSTPGRLLASGSSYSVMAYVPRPTPGEMRQAPRTYPAAYLRYTDFDLPRPGLSGLRPASSDPARAGVFDTPETVGAPAPGLAPASDPRVARRILASPYGPMYRLARRLTSGTRSPYDSAMAIQTYLEANYPYSEAPPARRYPLEAFLFLDRIGYCQQFSGAMALMLRMVGVPARVAVGFQTGEYESSTGRYRVSALDAHSWVEVYFDGIGWVAFDPTPPPSVGGTRYFPLFTQHTPSALQAIAATIGGPPPVAAARHATARRKSRHATAGVGPDVGLTLGALALLSALAGGVRWTVGRRRLARSLCGDGEVAARELVGALRRLGYELPVTVTLAQIETLVRVHGGGEAARYVRRLRDLRYAPSHTMAIPLGDRRRLRHGLTAHLGWTERLRGQLALPPGTLGGRLRRS